MHICIENAQGNKSFQFTFIMTNYLDEWFLVQSPLSVVDRNKKLIKLWSTALKGAPPLNYNFYKSITDGSIARGLVISVILCLVNLI